MAADWTQQQEEHRRAHQLNAETAHNYDLATDDNVQTRRQMMDWKIQCGQWKERFNELESQTGKRIEELESQSKLILTHDKGTQTNSSEPGTGEGADSEATIQTPSHDALWYCNVCLKSVDKQSDDVSHRHRRAKSLTDWSCRARLSMLRNVEQTYQTFYCGPQQKPRLNGRLEQKSRRPRNRTQPQVRRSEGVQTLASFVEMMTKEKVLNNLTRQRPDGRPVVQWAKTPETSD